MSGYQPYSPPATAQPATGPTSYGYHPAPNLVPVPGGRHPEPDGLANPAIPYPVQPYGAQQEHPQATTVLILGVIGLFTGILGPVAWYLGNKAQRECNAGMYVSTGALKAGRILGIVETILILVSIAIVVVGLAAFIVVGATAIGG